ncbi:MAG: type II toxin-antitoxin system VapC family toxin [Verrucomicrobia bacterium]|nr:type II toxin-antitoxin system VapC family toxin [Verrucomicrobiota bacterium]
MARHFVDTSALVKLYRVETLSAQVQAVVQSTDTLVISALTTLEFQSAFFSLVRQQIIDQSHAIQRIHFFQADLSSFEIVLLTPSILASAERLLSRFAVSEGLRPADAIQLAAAMEASSSVPFDTFLTTDSILKSCALASGFVVKP